MTALAPPSWPRPRFDRLSEWLAAGAPELEDATMPVAPGEVVVAPLSNAWPWVGCPDCRRPAGRPHLATCAVHDEPD